MAELLRSKDLEKSTRAVRHVSFTANTHFKACPLCAGRMYLTSKRCNDCSQAIRGFQWKTRSLLQEMLVRDEGYAERLALRIKRLHEALTDF